MLEFASFEEDEKIICGTEVMYMIRKGQVEEIQSVLYEVSFVNKIMVIFVPELFYQIQTNIVHFWGDYTWKVYAYHTKKILQQNNLCHHGQHSVVGLRQCEAYLVIQGSLLGSLFC
jgi:hypothetical protein